MRITQSSGYHSKSDCSVLSDCERRYCSEHRLLWNDCETGKMGYEGDGDVINGLHTIMELGDCPQCEQLEKRKKIRRQMERNNPNEVLCPVCFFMVPAADEVAVHLISEHSWDYEKARLWLRDTIEEKAFHEEA